MSLAVPTRRFGLAASLLALFALGACTDQASSAREAASPDSTPTDPGSVPAGRLPPGTTYDFGDGGGGVADVGGAYYLGQPDAPVTVATFGDFQCTFCARSERATAAAREDLLEAGAIRVLYLDFPLSIHARGEPAAEFARCVGRVDGARAFWRTYRALHRRQDSWSRGGTVESGLRQVAEAVGVSWSEVDACMESDVERPAVERFRRLGQGVGVRGTPTSFFNGARRVGAITGPVFRRMVEATRPGVS